MNFRDLAPWLLAPAALFALAAPRTSITRSEAVHTGTTAAKNAPAQAASWPPSSPAAAPQTPKRLDRYCDDARHLLWKFVNASEPPPEGGSTLHLAVTGNGKAGQVSLDEDIKTAQYAPCENYPTDDKLQPALKPFDLRFLVATLPDPVNSHLPNEFDVGLEAIRAAAAQARYSMDRFYLPWENQPEVQSSKATESDATPPSEIRPGLILFRRNCNESDRCGSKYSRLVLLFIVGENPTSGIHKLALSSALEQLTELAALSPPVAQSCDNRDCTKVGLLAPYFTGSVPSLRLSLKAYLEWASQNPGLFSKSQRLKFVIISGDARGVDLLDFDSAPFNSDFFQGTFRATVGYEVEVRDAFLEFLSEKLGVSGDKVAILRESDTGYGQSFASPTFGGLIAYLDGLGREARGLALRLLERYGLLFKIQGWCAFKEATAHLEAAGASAEPGRFQKKRCSIVCTLTRVP